MNQGNQFNRAEQGVVATADGRDSGRAVRDSDRGFGTANFFNPESMHPPGAAKLCKYSQKYDPERKRLAYICAMADKNYGLPKSKNKFSAKLRRAAAAAAIATALFGLLGLAAGSANAAPVLATKGFVQDGVRVANAYADSLVAGLASVAITGDYNDLANKPAVGTASLKSNNVLPLETSASESLASGMINLHKVSKTGSYADLNDRPAFAVVATTGSYTDLINKPNEDMPIHLKSNNVLALTPDADEIVTHGTTINVHKITKTGSWNDLNDKPNFANVATSAEYSDLINPPSASNLRGFNRVAFTGKFTDLSDIPDNLADILEDGLPTLVDTNTAAILDTASNEALTPNNNESLLAGVVELHKISKTGSYADLREKPSFALVATSGNYNDLINKPTIGTANLKTNNVLTLTPSESESLSSGFVNLHKISKTGKYSDLIDIPSFAVVATSGNYADLINKPTIPSVPSSMTLTKAANGTAATLAVLTSDSTATNAMKYKTLASGSNVSLTATADTITIAATDTNTTYAAATNTAAGLLKLNQAAADATINAASTTAGKFYPVNLTTAGVAYVNVPWTDTTPSSLSLTKATTGTAATLGVLTSDSTATNAMKYKTLTGYNVTLNPAADSIQISVANASEGNKGVVQLTQQFQSANATDLAFSQKGANDLYAMMTSTLTTSYQPKLPDYTAADIGKALSIVDGGGKPMLQWVAASSGSLDLGSATGTLAVAKGGTGASTAAAKSFFAAPNGAAGAPSFRAIVASDIPTLNQNTTGSAGTATKLATARTIQVSLGASSAASFDGSANITPGVSGILSVQNGGTGGTTIAAAKASLGIIDVPAPPATGEYVLKSNNGVMSWVLLSSIGGGAAPECGSTQLSKSYGTIQVQFTLPTKADFTGHFSGTYMAKGQGPYNLSFDFNGYTSGGTISNLNIEGNATSVTVNSLQFNTTTAVAEFGLNLGLDSWTGAFSAIKQGGSCVSVMIQ
ncbi:MAG: hypothetical protein LBL46_00785 [Rickettsiales bacterium]|jgi:hypothetical protein|nr:hypothetical protein [Rickettsiales bacterium]